jgi:hypothetical protein
MPQQQASTETFLKSFFHPLSSLTNPMTVATVSETSSASSSTLRNPNVDEVDDDADPDDKYQVFRRLRRARYKGKISGLGIMTIAQSTVDSMVILPSANLTEVSILNMYIRCTSKSD